MGTEVVTSSDGSLAALLGASPGASTAVTIMIEVLNRCWQEKMKSSKWKNKMLELFPSMGTEVVTSSDGSLAALLGASPGASTAVTIMIEVLNRCWQEKMKSSKWRSKMLELFPSIETDINSNQEALLAIRKRNDFLLKLI